MHFTQNKTQLTIIIDDDEKRELQELKLELGDEFQSDKALHDFLEPLIANSELEWISPSDTGDLTDAPMLGILGEEGIKSHTVFLDNFGLIETGKNGHWTYARPILNRWAYMDYQVRSPLNDLLAIGWANFVSQ